MSRWLLCSLALHIVIITYFLRVTPPEMPAESAAISVDIHKPLAKRVSASGHGGQTARINPHVPDVERIEASKEAEREISAPMEAKSNIYYSFYKRIWSQAFLDWRNEVSSIVSRKKLTRVYQTKLWLIWTSKGMIESIVLVQSSGVPELDRAAIKAFEGRFVPNPPKTLVDKDGKFRLLWTFTVGG